MRERKRERDGCTEWEEGTSSHMRVAYRHKQTHTAVVVSVSFSLCRSRLGAAVQFADVFAPWGAVFVLCSGQMSTTNYYKEHVR